MRSILIRDAIIPSLQSDTKEGVIRELVVSLAKAGYFKLEETEKLMVEILRREELGSTGIGRGVAIPHSRHAGLPRLIGTLGLAKNGLEFDAIDGAPVYVVFLMVSRPDQPSPHLRALETVVRLTADDSFLERLQQCTTVDEIWALIEEVGS